MTINEIHEFRPKDELDRFAHVLKGQTGQPAIMNYEFNEMDCICQMQFFYEGNNTYQFVNSLPEYNFYSYDRVVSILSVLSHRVQVEQGNVTTSQIEFNYKDITNND